MKPNPTIGFNAVLASSVHDIKNSLATLRELMLDLKHKHQDDNQEFIQLEFETNRMNNSLMQLLTLYKIESNNFSLHIEECPVMEIFQEVKAQHAPFLTLKQFQLTINCEQNHYCYCDYMLICNALASLLNNAQRYCNQKIHLSTYQKDHYQVICLEDDGSGYPEYLLDGNKHNQIETNWLSGNTGLGLHFISVLASLHKNKNKQGFISIDNASQLGGARLQLFLP